MITGKFNVGLSRVMLATLCVVSLFFLVTFSDAEEPIPQTVNVGILGFVYVPAVDQPLPHVANGYLISDEPIGTLHVPAFYLASRVVEETDFPDFFRTLRVDYPGFTAFSPYVAAEFVRYMNEQHKKPFVDAGVDGSFTLPRWEDMMAAFLRGGAPAEAAQSLQNKLSFLANRWSEDADWDGEDVGGLAAGGQDVRREFLGLAAWPDLCTIWPLKKAEDFYRQKRNQDPTRTWTWEPLDIMKTSERIFLVFRTKEAVK